MPTFDLSPSNLELLNQRLDSLGYYAMRGSNGKVYLYRIERGAASYGEDALRKVRDLSAVPPAVYELMIESEDKEYSS